MKPTTLSLNVTDELKEKLDEAHNTLQQAYDTIKELRCKNNELEKISIPVYDHYKQFKNIAIGTHFVYGPHMYKRCEQFNMLGEYVNAEDLRSNQFEYIYDNAWVIEIN